jgi:protein SCO1/2
MTLFSRRSFLVGVSSSLIGVGSGHAQAHNDAGRVVPPLAVPEVELTLDDDKAAKLSGFTAGHVTAVQLMFTSCQATCPIQGALFAEAAKKLGDKVAGAQLLSISIDPDHDSPAELRGWLEKFGRSPLWRAARPKKDQLQALVDVLKSKKPGPDPHTAQVYYLNRKGELVMRSVDFPPASDIARSLEQLAAKK